MSAGRPATGKYKIKEMIEIIRQYTDDSFFPILKEVCFENDWDYQYIMNLQSQNKQLRESIKRLLNKKEIALEKGVHAGKLDRTMAIFTLKQPAHGWKDKQEPAPDTDTIKIVLERKSDGNKNNPG